MPKVLDQGHSHIALPLMKGGAELCKLGNEPIEVYNPMKNNIRIVPIHKLCVLCGQELQAHETVQDLAGRLCRACLRLVHEQVFFPEIEQYPKIVRVQ